MDIMEWNIVSQNDLLLYHDWIVEIDLDKWLLTRMIAIKWTRNVK